MIKIGLTGSIGMGKSTVAQMFGDLGAMVWDADAAVHRMYARGGAAVEPVGALFPDVIVDGAVDRARLASVALGAPANLQKLEAVVHPLVAADREAFMTAAAHAGAPAVVLDIPLLFENGSEKFFDVVVVVNAPADMQRARALARPGMSEDKFAAILAEQMPDAEKCAKADYVISTGQSLDETRDEARCVYKKIMARTRP
jgi:dephospho-CoA kinase